MKQPRKQVEEVFDAVKWYQNFTNVPDRGTRCVSFYKAMFSQKPEVEVVPILKQLASEGFVRFVTVPEHGHSSDMIDLHVELLHVT